MTDPSSSPAQLKDACGALAELRALTPKDFKAYHAVIDKAEAALSQGCSSDNMSPKPNGCNPCDWPECGCQGNVQQGNLYSGDFAAEFMETIWEGCTDRDCLPKCRTNDGHCERLKLEYDEWLRRAPSLTSADVIGGK